MKKLLLTAATFLQLSLVSISEAAQMKNITFESNNQTLAGNLYLPDDYQQRTNQSDAVKL